MRRVLKFGEGDRDKFKFLYTGFLNGGNGTNAKGVEVLRREGRILDKLEAISTEELIINGSDTPVLTGERILKEGPQELSLEEPEYQLLQKYFQNTPWNTKVARQVVNTIDWLAAVPLEENGA